MVLRISKYFVLSILIYTSWVNAQDVQLTFDHLNIKNGLSDGRVDCILQDSRGFLWIGTQDGLNRFDGYNFTVYDHDVFDSTSLSSNWVRCILEDGKGRLWVGTEGGGLDRFDYESDTFVHWMNNPTDENSLNDNFVRVLLEDHTGTLWIGTRTGLEAYNESKNTFIPLLSDPSNLNSTPFNENVTQIIEDSHHDIWIGTSDDIYHYDRRRQSIYHYTSEIPSERIACIFEDSYGVIWSGSRYHGLRRFNREKRTFVRYMHDPSNANSLSSNEIKVIFEDKQDLLWIGTMHGGLNLYDRNAGRFLHFVHDAKDPTSLSSNSVRRIYQDRTGVIWLGMDGSGLDRFVRNKYKFKLYGPGIQDPDHVIHNTVLSILEDTKGHLWIGTEGGGLNGFSSETGQWIQYQSKNHHPESLSSNQVTCLVEDSDGTLWVGTKEGLNHFNPRSGIFKRYYVTATPVTGNNFINVIHQNPRGELLLGTNGGLIRFDKQSQAFTHLDYDSTGMLNDEMVVTLCKDHAGYLWIGYLRSGLVRLLQASNTITHFRSNPDIPNSLSSNFVQYLFEDSSHRLWIGTRNGLNQYNPEEETFIRYTKTDGLPSNVIVGILEDRNQNLWLSTTNGISKFNTDGTFNNYNVDDGLQGNQFWIRSCFQSRSGELFFGGNNGFNAFYPETIDEMANPHIPPIVITHVRILNQPLLQSIQFNTTGSDTVILAYNENRISFEFAALDFTRPEKNQFAYRLLGFEENWNYAGTRRYANYTNLDPGYYTFQVKGSNNDGVWNEVGTSLNIYIAKPFWKTWWAYLIYVVGLAGLIYGINAYILSLIRVKHDLKIERMEKEKNKEINQFKLQFFTDIAHELKTPLTLIQAPLEEILASVKKGSRFEEEFRLMHRNVRYLLRLIGQLLLFRRTEQGRMSLDVSKGDLVQFARNIFELFVESSKKHHIQYEFETEMDQIEGWFDWEKMEEILVNLIDNAFKYTPDYGQISIFISQIQSQNNGEQFVTLNVQDSGVGISPDQIEHVFERFYHGGDGHHQSQASSGLGLALTQKLVQMHHGTIQVESKEGQGACFEVTLPLDSDHYSDSEIATNVDVVQGSGIQGRLLVEEDQVVGLDEADGADENSNLPLVLIVEDNAELRTYMKKSLSKKYAVALAEDGIDGVEKAKSLLPSIIISDIIMPRLDGIGLCETLKCDIATSHIPIILLTARHEIEHKIKGLETGADDYIEKPFHFAFLDARISNILKSREALRKRYRNELLMEPADVPVVSTDEKWLVKVREYVETHMEDSDLDVKHLSSELGLSRTMLFIKLKELTGTSPQEFIRILRLQKAAQHLKNSDLTVSEIAYRVGFKYPKYFSTCFSKQFHLTPSEYRDQEKI